MECARLVAAVACGTCHAKSRGNGTVLARALRDNRAKPATRLSDGCPDRSGQHSTARCDPAACLLPVGHWLSYIGTGLSCLPGCLACVGAPLFYVGGTLPYVGGSLPYVGGTLSYVGGTLSYVGGTLSYVGGTLSYVGGTLSYIGGTLLVGTGRNETKWHTRSL